VIFILHKKRASEPILDLNTFSRRLFSINLVTGFFTYHQDPDQPAALPAERTAFRSAAIGVDDGGHTAVGGHCRP
jgi:hypothetical protein